MPIIRMLALICSYLSLLLIAAIFISAGDMWGYGDSLEWTFYIVIPGAIVGFFLRMFQKNKPVLPPLTYVLNSTVTVVAFLCAVLLCLVLMFAPDFNDAPTHYDENSQAQTETARVVAPLSDFGTTR